MMIEPLTTAGSFGRYHVAAALAPTVVYPGYLAVGPDGGAFTVRTAPAFLAEDPEYRMALRHRAVAATRLSARSVTPVFDVDADAETPWVASPFVAGVTVTEEIAAHGPLPEAAARVLAAALAEALAAIHAAGLVHRSLRPDTVSLAADGLRVTDAGLPSVLEFPYAARRPDAIPGPPDCLSPEQATGAEAGPASDIFAYGALVAFAASGVRPFGAPSVPYTLFNIAQRDPDLSAVPESLRPLITACLRKDPRTRPTAAQVSEYLGVPQFSPPPWPEAVLAEVGRRERVAAEAVVARRAERQRADAERERDPRLVAADLSRRARGAVASARRRAGHTSRRTRIGVAAAVAAVLVATVGFTVLREPPEPVTALSLDQLRRIDACAWLKSAMGEEVPLASGPVPIEGWELSASADWGCYATTKTHSFAFAPGEQLSFVTPTATETDGVTIKHTMSCGRAIAAADNDEAGVVFEQTRPDPDDECEPALDRIAAELARTLVTAPTLPDLDVTLAAADPCAALDRGALDAEIGPLPPRPVVGDAHTCQWSGTRDVELTFATGALDPSGYTSSTVGEAEYHRKTESDGSSCTVVHRFRDLDPETAELVTLRVTGARGEPDRHCALAATAIQRVVENLRR